MWILIRKLLGSTQIHENERIWNRFASWKRSEPCAKTAKSVEIRQNRRKSSMSTLQKSSKNRVSSTSRWHFPKSCDFHARSAFGHVPVTLCPKRRNFADFDPKIAGCRGPSRRSSPRWPTNPGRRTTRRRTRGRSRRCTRATCSAGHRVQKLRILWKSVKIAENPR